MDDISYFYVCGAIAYGTIVRCYSKVDEPLILEASIPDIDLRVFQVAFGIDGDNPMYDCYPLGSTQIAVLNKWWKSKIDYRFLILLVYTGPRLKFLIQIIPVIG